MVDSHSTKFDPNERLPRDTTGVIYSFTIVHVGFGHMADKAPYALLMVEPESSDRSNGSGNVTITKSADVIQMGILYSPDISSLAIGQKVRFQEFDPEVGNVFTVG